MELTSLSFDQIVADYLETRNNNTFVLNNYLGAFKKNGEGYVRMNYEIDFKNEHQRETFCSEMQPKLLQYNTKLE